MSDVGVSLQRDPLNQHRRANRKQSWDSGKLANIPLSILVKARGDGVSGARLRWARNNMTCCTAAATLKGTRLP
ncbi:hypothetical protein DPEC_G00012120 [Dallia pectoralis]|uniref:Uncharacterized protein n=1 Tax=Dallia pectoralis TaxID=75939 RepID=A0ACC2HM57_DALPE|nr:hypothetical protein DPEC_G00012120 [Dallia pectoralis]